MLLPARAGPAPFEPGTGVHAPTLPGSSSSPAYIAHIQGQTPA
jgi:hypothetical protein